MTKFLDIASTIRHIALHIRNIDAHQATLRDSFLLLGEDVHTLYDAIELMHQQQDEEAFRHHFGPDVSYESLMTVFHPIFVAYLGLGGAMDTPAVLNCYEVSRSTWPVLSRTMKVMTKWELKLMTTAAIMQRGRTVMKIQRTRSTKVVDELQYITISF